MNKMVTDGVLDDWHRLQLRQSEWAFRAYDKLVATLSEDVQERLQLRESDAEPYVVLFGKTQVGKTTLLLDLMGIDLQHMAALSLVLRGGREAGKSATATAMEYRRSADERWGLFARSETSWFDSDDKMSDALGRLRKCMEKGELVVESPCIVHIPRRFFRMRHSGMPAPSVRILDLPGDNPANEEEQKHVSQMAKTYLPFADLILLIGRGDDLSFLRPNAITLPGIDDWQAIPHRFRIVTTYSYSAQSVKELIRNDPGFDITRLRQRLIEQIERFDRLSEAAKNPHLYFPLEFGSSWLSMEANDNDLYLRVAPMVSHLRNELLEQITTSTSPMGRLRSTLDTHLSVKYVQQKKTEVIEAAIQGLNKENEAVSRRLDVWETSIEKASRKINQTSELLQHNKLSDNQLLIDSKATEAARFELQGDYSSKKCSTLNNMITDYCHNIKKIHLNPGEGTYWTKVRRVCAEPSHQAVQDILDDAFGYIRYVLNDYWSDSYIFSDNFSNDRRSVIHASEKAKSGVIQLWKNNWNAALGKVDAEYQGELRKQESGRDMMKSEQRKSLRQQADILDSIEFHQNEKKRVATVSQEDLKRCEKFVNLLDEEYLATLEMRLNAVYQEKDPCDSLLQLFSCVALKDQHEDLMTLTENHSG